jgi:hypothetical protein
MTKQDDTQSVTIPFHSDFHRDVTLYLANNRHLSHQERITKVYDFILLHGVHLNIELLVHYAANLFTTMDGYFLQTQGLPQILYDTVIGAKAVSDHLEKDRKSNGGKNANTSRVAKYTELENKLKPYWISNICPRNIESNKENARQLMKSEIYKDLGDNAPVETTLAEWVKKWKTEK